MSVETLEWKESTLHLEYLKWQSCDPSSSPKFTEVDDRKKFRSSDLISSFLELFGLFYSTR